MAVILDTDELLAVDIFGNPIIELDAANIIKVTHELDQPGAIDFDQNTTDPKLAALLLRPDSEVQYKRNGVVRQWGPWVRADATRTATKVQCQGLFWYYHRRSFGIPGRTQLLLDPDFEQNPAGGAPAAAWTASGLTSAVVENTDVNTGVQAVELNAAAELTDSFLGQLVNFTTTAVGNSLFLVGWYKIPADGSFIGPALFSRGLFLDYKIGGVSQTNGNYIVPISNAVVLGQWVRVEVTLEVPNASTAIVIDARPYCPGGKIRWDSVSLWIDESLSFMGAGPDFVGEDMATIAQGIVAYGQGDDAFAHKSPLNITYNCPATSILLPRAYHFTDRRRLFEDGLAELTQLFIGLDYDFVFPDANTRVFTTYGPVTITDGGITTGSKVLTTLGMGATFAFSEGDVGTALQGFGIVDGSVIESFVDDHTVHMSENATATVVNVAVVTVGRRKGIFKPDWPLRVDLNDEESVGPDKLDDFIFALDKELAASDIVVTGNTGSGVTQDQGGYADASGLNGLVLDEVQRAPNYAQLDALNPLAVQIWRTKRLPVPIPQFIVHDPAYYDNVFTGDTVPAFVRYGWIDFEMVVRVVKIEYEPRFTKTTFTVNII